MGFGVTISFGMMAASVAMPFDSNVANVSLFFAGLLFLFVSLWIGLITNQEEKKEDQPVKRLQSNWPKPSRASSEAKEEQNQKTVIRFHQRKNLKQQSSWREFQNRRGIS